MGIQVPVMDFLVALIVMPKTIFASAPICKNPVLLKLLQTVTSLPMMAKVDVYVHQRKKLVMERQLILVLTKLAIVEKLVPHVKKQNIA